MLIVVTLFLEVLGSLHDGQDPADGAEDDDDEDDEADVADDDIDMLWVTRPSVGVMHALFRHLYFSSCQSILV